MDDKSEISHPIKIRKWTYSREELLFYIMALTGMYYDFTEEPVLFYRKHGPSAMSNIDGQRDSYVKLISKVDAMQGVTKNQVSDFEKRRQV